MRKKLPSSDSFSKHTLRENFYFLKFLSLLSGMLQKGRLFARYLGNVSANNSIGFATYSFRCVRLFIATNGRMLSAAIQKISQMPPVLQMAYSTTVPYHGGGRRK